MHGGIEAGGTKFVCALGTGPDDVRAVTQFPTTRPDETLQKAIAFFEEQPARPEALGIGSFGPVDLHLSSPTYGHITNTPKPHWQDTDVAGPLGRALGVPVAFETDVNAAALGEGRWGAAQDVRSFVYLTVGTGVGGGVMIEGRLLHGLVHPELGHVRVPRAPKDDFAGTCPFHGDCLEGLASGPALEARWGQPATDLPDDHPAWELEAYYLAAALAGFVCTLSPERIVMGGGVMQRRHLFPAIRERLRALLGSYVDAPPLRQMNAYVVPPGLGGRSGVLGALALAHNQAKTSA